MSVHFLSEESKQWKSSWLTKEQRKGDYFSNIEVINKTTSTLLIIL
jgi:hypothetical protein